MDYDNTMVLTDEKNRIFPPFAEDQSRVIEPTGALVMVGMPTAIFTGNKPSYIDSQCIDGFRAWLHSKGKVDAMQRFSVYSQNSTWLQVFDNMGEVVPEITDSYAEQYIFPPQHIKAIEAAFIDPLQRAMADRFMCEKPIRIRPAGSKEMHYAYGPIFENRGGVQLSWIAVPGETREKVIAAAVQTLDQDIRSAYRFEPGGDFSIDINHSHVAKNKGTVHFRGETGSSLLLYFGDSVHIRGQHEGNDLPVVRDPNAIIFAVNAKQDEIPEHERIIRAGIGPDATRAWLTWILIKYVSVRFATEHISTAEKVRMLDALIASGLTEDVEIG